MRKNKSVSYFNDVPDKPLEPIGLGERNSQQSDPQAKELENIKEIRSKRVLQKGRATDKYSQAIDTIIEFAKASAFKEFIIYSYNFNFDDNINSRTLLESFLEKLKTAKCFIDWKRGPAATRARYIFERVNIKELSKYKNKIKQESERDITPYLGFEDNLFWLQRLGKSPAVINFYPTEEGGLDMFYLMKALVAELINNWIKKGGRTMVMYSKEDVSNYVEKRFHLGLGSRFNNWFRFTKSNLVKKIPVEHRRLIRIGSYDRKLKAYSFSVKLPI